MINENKDKGVADVVAFKRSSFRSDLIDAARVLNFDIEPIREGFEVLNFPVMTDRGVLRMECSFQLMRPADVEGGAAVPVAPSMSGVLKACAALGDMVRIAVDPKGLLDLGESLKDKGESVPGCDGERCCDSCPVGAWCDEPEKEEVSAPVRMVGEEGV